MMKCFQIQRSGMRPFALAAMVLAVVALFASSALALSDKEYLRMKKECPAFAKADKELGQVWNEAKKTLSESDFNKLKKQQQK